MSPSIDFSEVQGLEPVEAGTYEATIVFAEEGMSQSGNPKIDIRWMIEEGQPNEGRQVFDTLSFHQDALWRTKLALQALGFPEDFSGDVETEDLLNASAAITVSIEDSEQIDPTTNEPYPPRNRVMKVRPSGASAASLLS
jgi:hypothetical protein